MTLRPIKPMTFPDITPNEALAAETRPVLRWVPPCELMVDETYQRDLSRKSIAVIKGAVSGFSWAKYKPPIVTEDGAKKKLHVIDGQHTAIAAATIGLKSIPVFIVGAESLDARARAFVAHNTDRVRVTSIQMWHALVAAGDPDACDVANVCKRAGVRIREYSQASAIAEGDTKAVGLIRKLVDRHGVQKARIVLQALVKAKLAPLDASAIRAAAEILCVSRPQLDPEHLTAAIRIDGGRAGIAKAEARAKVKMVSAWSELTARWLKLIDEA